jgi:hypothetical protein
MPPPTGTPSASPIASKAPKKAADKQEIWTRLHKRADGWVIYVNQHGQMKSQNW